MEVEEVNKWSGGWKRERRWEEEERVGLNKRPLRAPASAGMVPPPPPHWFKVASATFLASGSYNKWSCDIIVIADEGSRAEGGSNWGSGEGEVGGFF